MMQTPLHTRSLFIETHPLDAERLYVHAELRDVRYQDLPAYLGVEHPSGVVHHMGLDLEIDDELVIRDVEASMATFPFSPSDKTWGEACPNILANYRRLIGVKLDTEYALRVLETVGGTQGCFHILSLAQCLPSAVRAATRRLCAGALQMPAGARENVLDSCSQWRRESPHWGAVRETPDNGFGDFRRQIRVSAHVEDGRLGLAGTLSDELAGREPYGAELRFVLEFPRFNIVSAEARLTGAPFPGCQDALDPVRHLETLSITKGFTGSALEKIGGGAGCAHLSALVVAVTPVLPQAAGGLAGFLKLRPDQKLRGRGASPQVDSCHMWRSGGPLVSLE
jgi:hypothetical protein